MNRQQFVDLIYQIGAVTGLAEVEIIGSQAIHGSLPQDKITGILARSDDLDAILAQDPRAANVMDMLGLGSNYDKAFKVHVDVVSETTGLFPSGWRGRRIAFQ